MYNAAKNLCNQSTLPGGIKETVAKRHFVTACNCGLKFVISVSLLKQHVR